MTSNPPGRNDGKPVHQWEALTKPANHDLLKDVKTPELLEDHQREKAARELAQVQKTLAIKNEKKERRVAEPKKDPKVTLLKPTVPKKVQAFPKMTQQQKMEQ